MPVEQVRVKIVDDVTTIDHTPFAAVFPPTPLIVMIVPVDKPCAADVVTEIGAALVAPEIVAIAPLVAAVT